MPAIFFCALQDLLRDNLRETESCQKHSLEIRASYYRFTLADMTNLQVKKDVDEDFEL